LAAPDSGSAPPAPLAAAPPPVAAQSVPAFGEVVRRQSEPKGDLIPIPPALGLVGKILGGILGALTIIGGIRVLMQEIPPGAPADAVTMITSIAVGMLASGLLLLLRLPMPGVGFTRAAYTYLGTLYGVGFGLIVIRGAFKDIRYFLAAVAAVALAGAVWGLRPKGRIVDLVMLCVLALPLLGMISTVVRFLSRVVLNF